MSRSSVKRTKISKLPLAITRMKDYKAKKHDLSAPKVAGPSLLRRSDVTSSTYVTIASSNDTHTSMPVTSIHPGSTYVPLLACLSDLGGGGGG